MKKTAPLPPSQTGQTSSTAIVRPPRPGIVTTLYNTVYSIQYTNLDVSAPQEVKTMESIESALHQAAEKLETLRSKSIADDHDDVFQGIRFLFLLKKFLKIRLF